MKFGVKEHCLMGIKGTVRRNQDGHFIHANIDLSSLKRWVGVVSGWVWPVGGCGQWVWHHSDHHDYSYRASFESLHFQCLAILAAKAMDNKLEFQWLKFKSIFG